MSAIWKDIQRHVGVDADGVPGDATAAAIAKALGLHSAVGGSPFEITARVAAELVGHEEIVPEAYKDSVGVWTWGVGVTSASGHDVARYKDKPQPIAKCLSVYIWLLREKYAPAVRAAFAGHELTEAQYAAALSFHYNTGAIRSAIWVAQWKDGEIAQARTSFMNWRNPPEILERRSKERDLFFDGKWSGDGTAQIIPVAKPSYHPAFGKAKRANIMADLRQAMEAA